MFDHIMRAEMLLNHGRYEMAIEEYRKALSQDPVNPLVHNRIAFALMQLGRWNEAFRSTEVSLEHAPNDPETHEIRTLLWLERSYTKEAEQSIRQAISLNPTSSNYYGLLGRILADQDHLNEALAATDNGLQIEPTNDICLSVRARVLSSLGRHEESSSISEMLLREDPLDAWNHCLRGEELLVQGKPHEARAHFVESLRLSPGNEIARQGFAIALKARSPIFGHMLAIFMWLGKFKAHVVWPVMGLLFAVLVFGDKFGNAHPDFLVPFEIVKAIVFSTAVFLFLGNPMFDLILRFDPEGRIALSDNERRATNWYIVCFSLAFLFAIWAIKHPAAFLPKQMAIATLYFCAPIREAFLSTPGYVRTRMKWLTIAIGTLLLIHPIVGPLLALATLFHSPLWAAKLALKYLLYLPVLCLCYCAFCDDLRQWLEKRRPD